ncbi:MAG: hypothetical protein ABID61_00430 [Candidatus Micrarchaeota archaeon]
MVVDSTVAIIALILYALVVIFGIMIVVVIVLAVLMLIFGLLIRGLTEDRIIDLIDVDTVSAGKVSITIGAVKTEENQITLEVYNKQKIQIPKKDIIGVVEWKRLGPSLVWIYYQKQNRLCVVAFTSPGNSKRMHALTEKSIIVPFGSNYGINTWWDLMGGGISHVYFGNQPEKLIENKTTAFTKSPYIQLADVRYLRLDEFRGMKFEEIERDKVKVLKLPFYFSSAGFFSGIDIYDNAVVIKSGVYRFIIPKEKIKSFWKVSGGYSIIHSAKNAPERIDVVGNAESIADKLIELGYKIEGKM